MALKPHVMLDSPASLDAFRREHYLYVYTAALELTASPAQANAIASRVFENAAKRFASMPVPENCDMYLSAQVHLIYAQQILPPLADDAAPAASATASVMDEPLSAQLPPAEGSSVKQRQASTQAKVRHTRTAHPVREQDLPPTQNVQGIQNEQAQYMAPPVHAAQPAQATQAAQTVYTTPSDHAAGMAGYDVSPQDAQPAPSAQAQVASPPAQPVERYSPPAQAADSPSSPAQAAQPPYVPSMHPAVQPVFYTQYIPVVQAMPYVPIPQGYTAQYAAPPQMQPTFAQAGFPYPASAPDAAAVAHATAAQAMPQSPSAQAQQPGALAPAPQEVIYNPSDTEFWTPDRDTQGHSIPTNDSRPIIDVPDDADAEADTPYWEDSPSEKPSRLLSLLNGILTLAGLGSIGFLLYQLGILPKFF